MKKILCPLPSYGFDPTEAAIPWWLLTQAGFDITFATPKGQKAACDIRMLKGHNLGVLRFVLQAKKDAIEAYTVMQNSESFCNPLTYDEIDTKQYDAILLPGGHDKGIKQYLESKVLQSVIVDFFNNNKPVAAICHAVVLVARSIDKKTDQSVIHNYQTTALLNSQELLAYNLTRLWLKDYYLTYPGLTVEDEVKSVLSNKEQFLQGPAPMFRDNAKKLKRGFFVKDRNYLSARWPGDVYNFSIEFIKMLQEPTV
ncbi:MAG: DJ-1/PfpI family protein [Saccharospirillaceae bacterium]|nr:type 1 glutamine amidotransferase domain-containing protein [Pseudomonadales bacterium]NRB79924.1 DJ-1/PfpI family protein [Saccharospirillaceae bacterium]